MAIKHYTISPSLVIIALLTNFNVSLAADVPNVLFGIQLGGIYEFTQHESKQTDNIPKKKFTGMRQGFGSGIHYFFQPLTEAKHFRYAEYKHKARDEFYETPFKIYLLPVHNKPSKNTIATKWEVLSIDWSTDVTKQMDAYDWAIKRCEEYRNHISAEAEITHFPSELWYECRFSSGQRVLNITGMATRINISLSYPPELIMGKENAIQK